MPLVVPLGVESVERVSGDVDMNAMPLPDSFIGAYQISIEMTARRIVFESSSSFVGSRNAWNPFDPPPPDLRSHVDKQRQNLEAIRDEVDSIRLVIQADKMTLSGSEGTEEFEVQGWRSIPSTNESIEIQTRTLSHDDDFESSDGSDESDLIDMSDLSYGSEESDDLSDEEPVTELSQVGNFIYWTQLTEYVFEWCD